MPNQDPEIARELLAHQTFLRRLAIDLVGTEADDLVQEVWRRALERPPHHGRRLRGWLARVARNLAADRWRGDARRTEREERRAREQPAEDALEKRLELRKELVEALDSLSPPTRETVLLRYFEGLAPRDIAKRQATPVATVKTRLRRGLAQLRTALDKRYGDDRATWMSAVTALAAPVGSGPVGSGVGTGTLMSGGIAMGTMMKVSGGVLVAAACVYFVTRTPPADPPRLAAVEESRENDAVQDEHPKTIASATLPSTDALEAEAVQRRPVADEPQAGDPTLSGAHVLRVILDGITEEEARTATVTLTGLDKRDGWPMKIGESWRCEGLTSEFDLDAALARIERRDDLRPGTLEVAVEHPQFLGARTGVRLDGGVALADGKTVHEVRVRLERLEFWPEFTLSVRDARTRAHLENVELRVRSGPWMSAWGRNNPSTLVEDGLSSPIPLMGARAADEPVATVAGVALAPAAGEAPRLVELARRTTPERGVTVSARAPGYAWGETSIDVSQSDRELLLEPATTLAVRLSNVQLERYAALETEPMLCVYWIRKDGGNQYVHFAPLDETLALDGLRLDSIVPGGYRVAVELEGGSWTEQPVLALEELVLSAGETRELVLALADPPAAPKRASLGGVVSFPAPTAAWAEENVRLQLYFQPTQRWRKPDFEFSLPELRRVGGALPSWSFRVEDLPVGMYRVQLMPFLKVWMINLEAGGAEDLELELPELAEVLVETVDGWSGERVPRDDLYYRRLEPVANQVQNDLAKADTEEPGLFRFWAAPGTVRVWPKWPNGAEREFGGNGQEFELVPGFQSVTFEFAPVHAMRFEFREDGTALPTGPLGLNTIEDIRAVDHDGRVTDGGLQRDMIVEVSAPGLYEIRFDGLDPDLYQPLPPRLVDVRPGETVDVRVELRRY